MTLWKRLPAHSLAIFALGLIQVILTSCSSPGASTAADTAEELSTQTHQQGLKPLKLPPEPIKLPEPKRFVIERISPYVESDYISSGLGGYPVRQYVGVKFVGETDSAHYAIDRNWALARPGDAVVFTPVLDRQSVKWDYKIEFAEFRNTVLR